MSDVTDKIRGQSTWQVLLLYLGGSFVALQVVEQVVESAGFPDWVRTYSLVLLTLGLPIVGVTAAIQGRRRSAASVEQGGADGQRDRPATRQSPSGFPAGWWRWFTWRNTALAGLAGFLIIALAVAAYVVMRTTGLGPVGTLEARGSIAEGAQVVLADFESADPELGSVVTNTLRIDLLQSPFLNVLEPSELEAGLGRMELAADETITPEIARELAIRDGFDAVIEGEVGSVGDGYVLTARIVGGDDWTSLAAFRSTARSDDDLIDAIEKLSRDIRDKSGESLRSARGGPPLRAVTTSSADALRAYHRGIEAYSAGEGEAALEWYERAIAIDPDFAMAHRRLAAMLGNLGIRRADQIQAATRAYELRDRLTEQERLLAEAFYHSTVVIDIPAAIRTYEAIIELAPTATTTRNARNNLAVWYLRLGRHEDAERLYADLVAERPYQSGFSTLALTRVALGDIEGAETALDEGGDLLPGAAHNFENLRVRLMVALGDIPRARGLAAGFAERYPGPRDAGRRSNQSYLILASEGRLEAALGAIEASVEDPAVRAAYRAVSLAVRGDSVGAVRVLLEGWEATRATEPLNRPYWLASVLVPFGGLEPAEEIMAEWRREVPVELIGFFGRLGRLEIEADMAYARGSIEESIELWELVERTCDACSVRSSYGLGKAYEAAGDFARAIAEYERHLTPYRQLEANPLLRADVLRRLARLHDDVGNIDAAASYYRRIVEGWRGADESLQPQVRAAQARLDELR